MRGKGVKHMENERADLGLASSNPFTLRVSLPNYSKFGRQQEDGQ